MRPTLLIGISAVLAFIATSAVAGADPKVPPPAIGKDAKGHVTFTPQGGTHINRNFPWSIKDSSDATKVLKAKSDFNFVGGANADEADSVSVTPAAGTLKGGYCGGGNCYSFTATCTASGCTVNPS